MVLRFMAEDVSFWVPQGGLWSKDPNNRALGPKYATINGIWALKPHYLGPWTLIRDNIYLAQPLVLQLTRTQKQHVNPGPKPLNQLTQLCPRYPL